MGERKRIDPKNQFSKKLAIWTALFWYLYTAWLSVIVLLQPAAALYSVYLSIISTVVMILNVQQYTHNSTTEKIILAALDKTRMELTLGNGKKGAGTNEESLTEGDEEG